MTARESMELSIIVPVYNVEQHLERCIQSIVAQAMTDYEIVPYEEGCFDLYFGAKKR